MKKIIFLFLMAISNKNIAQINIVPMPSSIVESKGNLELKMPITFIYKNKGLNGDGGLALFKKYLTTEFGIIKLIDENIPTKKVGTKIIIENTNQKDDAYAIVVTTNNVFINGNENGIFYAFETLKQLLLKNKSKVVSLPFCKIEDAPRFVYRGMHLDVSRHFFSVDYVKKYIDYLAAYKFNTFHWHLTDDQGWRIEIKKYPKLTSVGGCRDRTLIGRYGSGKYDNEKYCGYYTQAQIKEIVKYATDRYITVIPEIEMPGHSTAALASYPWLGCTKGPYKTMDTWGVLDDVYCAGNDSTFTFMQNIIDEVVKLFPATYIHIGGDECPKERWKKCDACQKRIKENNLKNEEELQSYFIQRIEKYINGKGKKIIGWDEILEGGLAANATVMSWRGEAGGIEAAKQGHDVIMTPGSHCYLDHSQTKNEDSLTIGSYLPLEKIYNYEPIPASLTADQAKHILGAQGNVWTEYIANTSKLEYMIFPRMIALSEALWSKKENKNWNNFEKRLPVILDRLDKQKINYSKAYYELNAKIIPTENNKGVLLKLESNFKGINKIIATYNQKLDKPEPVAIFNNEGKNIGNTSVYSREIDLSIKQTENKAKILIEKNIEITSKLIKGDNPAGIENVFDYKNPISTFNQTFNFNKATGKKITLTKQPNEPYTSDGAFTLVNGIQNTKGFGRSTEFIGFNGIDVEATIDFGEDVTISTIKIHCLDKNNSWIYLPSSIEVTPIPYFDTTVITRHAPLESTTKNITDKNNLQVLTLPEPKTCRSVRIYIKNYGKIPTGNAGEGKPAWLFVSEIEVD